MAGADGHEPRERIAGEPGVRHGRARRSTAGVAGGPRGHRSGSGRGRDARRSTRRRDPAHRARCCTAGTLPRAAAGSSHCPTSLLPYVRGLADGWSRWPRPRLRRRGEPRRLPVLRPRPACRFRGRADRTPLHALETQEVNPLQEKARHDQVRLHLPRPDDARRRRAALARSRWTPLWVSGTRGRPGSARAWSTSAHHSPAAPGSPPSGSAASTRDVVRLLDHRGRRLDAAAGASARAPAPDHAGWLRDRGARSAADPRHGVTLGSRITRRPTERPRRRHRR